MSAEAFGRSLPAVVTLDDLATMNAADRYGHRYELSPQGALSVMPLPDSEHAAIASRLVAWLAMSDGRRSRFCKRPASGFPARTATAGGSRT